MPRSNGGVASWSIVLFAGVVTPSASAQEPDEVAIPDFAAALAPDPGTDPKDTDRIDLGDVIQSAVYSVSKRAQLVRESPGIASVITRDQFRLYGWSSLNDVLFRQPGFAPSRDFERRVVAARGQFESWNNNHLLLLVDGVPFNDNLYGSAYTWEITPLDLASAVEVVRGPASALYGGSATSGLINIRTPSLDPGQRSMGGLVNVGLDGTQRYRAFGGQGERAGSVMVSYDRFDTPGEEYDTVDGSARDQNGDGSADSFRVQDQRTSQYLHGTIIGKQVANGLSLQLHHQRWRFETGHGWLFEIPNPPDDMLESRTLAALSYRRFSGTSEQELVIRYQRHDIDWRNRYYPAGHGCPGPACYPDGVREELETHTQDVFGRGQVSVDLPRQTHLLGGVEYTNFWYTGDRRHTSNIDLTTRDEDGDGRPDGTQLPHASGLLEPAGPFLERILGHPVHNIAAFLQLVSGQLLGRRVTATVGARYDRTFFHYNDLTTPRPYQTRFKSFQQLSPRAALVFFPTDQLSIKLLAGRGFRAPSPSELFGANTYALESNIDGNGIPANALQPETTRTIEVALDWAFADNWIWRGNLFHRVFNDQIAYRAGNNLSTNVYSNDTAGAETELLADFAVDGGRLQGFLNFSLVHLLDESITDPVIATGGALTWAPAQVGNLGLSWRGGKLEGSTQLHVQGPVRRRESDLATSSESGRASRLGGWATVDARFAVRLRPWALLGIHATNLFDDPALIIKNHDYPFDYRSDGRRVMLTLDLE